MYRRALGPLVLWLGLGVALVGAYVGYRSKGLTLFEPALAAVLYSLLFVLKYKPLLARYFYAYYPTTRTGISLVLFAFISGLAGAVVGELLQLRKQSRLKLVAEESGGSVTS